MTPKFWQSIEVHRGTFGGDGRLVFSGTPEETVSGNTFRRRAKEVVSEGEVITIDAQGFLESGAGVQVTDHLLVVAPETVSGQRYEVMRVVPGRDHRGSDSHVGVELRDTAAN